METKKLSNEFMQHTAESEAWKELSGDYPFNAEMLEKYADKLDWDEVSENSNINWTVSMLEKFKKRINWKKLSGVVGSGLLKPAIIEAFKDMWDWDELSDNLCLPLSDDFLFQYADRLNWSKVVDIIGWNHDLYEDRGIDFYEKYKEYIPEAKIQDTRLWREIVSQVKLQITNGIVSRG